MPMARRLYERAWREERSLEVLLGETQSVVSGDQELRQLAQEILDAHPDEVVRFQEGRSSLLRWFVGQAMRKWFTRLLNEDNA